MSDKLQIPGPDEPEDFTELDMTIVVSWAVCMILCIGLILVFRGRRSPPESAHRADPAGASGPVEKRHADIVARARRRPDGFAQIDFTSADAAAVFRDGPREATEAACRQKAGQLASGQLAEATHLELLKSVDRRARYAPWTCLLRRYWSDDLSADLGVTDEIAQVWARMRNFQASAGMVSSVMEDLQQNQLPTDNDQFYGWLRLCAIHPTYAASDACAALLGQIAPDQGRDVLAAVEKHFQERSSVHLRRDMAVIVAGVGHMARHGQPVAFRVEHSAPTTNYDTALRVGAAFVLCRIVHSPSAPVARQAAIQLAETAGLAARTTDENLLFRWRKTCTLAFHPGDSRDIDAGSEDGSSTDAPATVDPAEQSTVLAVSTGKSDEPPRYSLKWAVDRGDCPRGVHPLWLCGYRMWQARDQALDLSLMDFFTKTRYVEWPTR